MLKEAHRQQLKQLALSSIQHGIDCGRALVPDPAAYAPELRVPKATFVTLQRQQQLRGCIGMLHPIRPLVEDIAHNAWSAAFRDPRFPALGADEVADLAIHIAILGEPEALAFTSEQHLIAQIRPGIDGLILEDGPNRGTFLPSVWEALPAATDFISHLKIKAGLTHDYWSDTLRVQRYTVEAF